MSIVRGNKFRKWTALLALIALSSGCSHLSTSTTTKRAQLDMVDDTLPLLHVIINGKPAAFVVDTGAESTHIKPESARRLGLAIRPTKQKTTDAHNAVRRVLGVVNIDGYTTGNIKLHGQQAWCMDLPLPDGVDGLLSRSAFSDVVLTIDYPKRQLLIDEPSPDRNSSDTIPIGVHAQGAIRIPVTIGDKTEWFMVDTGFAGKLSMDESTINQVQRKLLTDRHESAGVNSQVMTSIFAINAPVTIGPHAFSDVTAVTFPGVRNMIGSNLLLNYRITIDQKNRLLSLMRVPGH